jgi:hypothetical protein
MAGKSTILRWRPDQAAELPASGPALSERFAALAGDRASSARELVLEGTELLAQWAHAQNGNFENECAHRELDLGLEAFERAHAWRGPVARWLAALRGVFDLARERAGLSARELLLEELGLWQGGEQGEGATETWRGDPLAPGVRLPERSAGARAIAPEIGREEIFLVHGWSETVAVALETLFGLGLAPRVLLSEGGADLGGRRMARRLSATGLDVELVYDLALFDRLPEADRMWLGTEAIGAGAFLARRGTHALLAEARREGVECTVVTTSDKLTPGGELALPGWPLEERWILWEDAPSRVELDSQTHERVPFALAGDFLTEIGREGAADLALRALPLPTT